MRHTAAERGTARSRVRSSATLPPSAGGGSTGSATVANNSPVFANQRRAVRKQPKNARRVIFSFIFAAAFAAEYCQEHA